jgi:hypothetical protein
MIFDKQMKYRILSEYSLTQDNLLANLALGSNRMSIPDALKAHAMVICKVQSVVFM